ncbi:M81 family metallopeptidase [Halomicrobium sp. LC1Hm]|uniref:M81 family metallopeptidase n=1 Tax=Halomicrobium sp. LC1Hm TaxID=2610902 RepID=UPI0012983387|nr:M81 family metallopeptidase [Halomicrobium sp. LC1Hm]
MRVAVATISHETNTFTDRPTTLADFETATGEALLDSFAAKRSLDGIVDRLREADVEVVPTVGAANIPSGTVTADAFEWMRSELADRLDADLDGVCLDLHGSMYVDGEPDPEGAILETVREAVGDDVPVTAALDMHATITEELVERVDGVAGYRTAPHTDVVETGERAADLLVADLRGELDLALAWESMPMILAGERSETEAEPMRTLIERLREADERPGVADANYFLGFPWADSPHAGCHALVTGDASARETVTETAADLATSFWERRREFDFTTEAHSPTEALTVAAGEDARPVAVAETGDIPGAGGSQDAVDFLERLLDRDDLDRPIAAIYADPDSYDTCVAAGAGATVELELGQFVDREGGLELRGTVERVESYERAAVAHLATDSADVFVADCKTNLHRDPDFFADFGLDLAERGTVVLKSGYLSPAWKEVAARRLFALTAGDTNQRVEETPYEHVPRPIYPADPAATFESNARWSA